ncbi:MAG: hypothetical protein ACD_39C02124G0002 [uncultured bacterium]|nr:MAG: hypothetical protein ACD_39C02124G0002 [uncultured bacterium]HBS52364.1 hypothetical protein [Coxiellaceae bacterium]
MPTIKKFWAEMTELNTHVIYIDACLQHINSKIKWLNATLAFASCGAVAGWMINNGAFAYWSVIIVISQTVSALRPHLFNWEKDAWSMKLASSELHSAFISMENDWYAVSNGMLEDKEIHDLWLSYKKQVERIVGSHLNSSLLNVKFWNDSFSKSEYYFNRYYKTGD